MAHIEGIKKMQKRLNTIYRCLIQSTRGSFAFSNSSLGASNQPTLQTGIKRMVDRQLEHGKKEEEQKRKEVLDLFKERARVHIIVHGKVQGVFFRDYAKKEAEKLGLTGWVKNTKTETVEITAEGDKLELRKFIVACEQGSPLAKVNKVEYKWEEYTGKFKEFYIHY